MSGTGKRKVRGNHYYRITTGIMVWQGQKAYAHIIREITAEKEREARLKSEALPVILPESETVIIFRKKQGNYWQVEKDAYSATATWII